MISRVFTADRFNEIANDPSVYPWICGPLTGPLDLTELIDNPNHIALLGDHGGVIMVQLQPGLYEAHTQVLPSGRGAWALALVKGVAKWMFTRTEAVELVTRVPRGNLGARALTRAVGGELEFTIRNGWIYDGRVIEADIFSLPIQHWLRTADGLEARGEWFHDRLREEYDRAGKIEPIHPDDNVHDRYVGGAIEMILGGQAHKGIVFYNRWAATAGYQTIEIVCHDPLTFDIRDAILVFRDNDFWMI